MSTPSALVVSRLCRGRDGAGVAVLGTSGPPPPSACNWPTAVRRATISPSFSSKQPMSSSVRPSKAALEQNPSSPRALATAFRQKRSKIKQAGHVSDFAGAAQSARFSPCLSLYPFSLPPHLNNRPLIGPPILYSPLHLSLPSLHPASCPPDTPAPQCSHAPLAVVTWCLNSSSLSSANSTLKSNFNYYANCLSWTFSSVVVLRGPWAVDRTLKFSCPEMTLGCWQDSKVQLSWDDPGLLTGL